MRLYPSTIYNATSSRNAYFLMPPNSSTLVDSLDSVLYTSSATKSTLAFILLCVIIYSFVDKKYVFLYHMTSYSLD